MSTRQPNESTEFARRTASVFLIVISLAFSSAPTAWAHVGSPNVFFEGPAGPYPVRVTIEPPGVVPGLAQIHVRVHSGEVQRVSVLPVRWDVGTKGSPEPDTAKLVPGETNLFTAQLWLMEPGAYSIFVEVSGTRGTGTAIVPLNSLASQRLEMSRGMETGFLVFGILIGAFFITLVGAAIRESVLPPGLEPSPKNRRQAVLGMAFAVVLVSAALYLGNMWWDSVDRDYRFHRLYRPQQIETTLSTDAEGRQVLTLSFPETSRMDSTPLVPDHSHLMHLFLIREPDGSAFAHLHPLRDARAKTNVFIQQLPALPAGDYALYADITHESGLTQTLTNRLHLPAPAATAVAFSDPDDSVDLAAPASVSRITFSDGCRLDPACPAAFRVNEETTLQFNLTTSDGAAAPLEEYLGMYGHLLIQDADGGVFNHLHPLGTISMVSQRLFAEREKAGYLANKPLEQFCSPAEPVLSFPYAFPKAGRYRLWLQTKVGGQIRTAAYAVSVE
jgi:hypothetical protein